MTEQRQAFELKNATGKLTVMYLSTTPDFEKQPRRRSASRSTRTSAATASSSSARRSSALRRASGRSTISASSATASASAGSTSTSCSANHFNVVTGSSYDGLFEMLVNKRFDIFLRAAVEVLDEYDQRKKALPDLAIEDSIVFYYPLPMYFWFPKTDEGRRLAARAEEGMRMMIADGTYDRIFDKYQRHKIERLRLKERRIFRIANPFVGPETPFADKRLWFDPRTYK